MNKSDYYNSFLADLLLQGNITIYAIKVHYNYSGHIWSYVEYKMNDGSAGTYKMGTYNRVINGFDGVSDYEIFALEFNTLLDFLIDDYISGLWPCY